jgi:hypothetical protein
LTASQAITRPIDASVHHGSHRQLLTDIPSHYAPQVRVDALLIPTCRPAQWLGDAMALARELDCGVVAICSGNANAVEVIKLGDRLDVSVLAIDLINVGYGIPTFSTAQLTQSTVFRLRSDASLKRNLALVLSRVAGWERVLFLDDDIFAIAPVEARSAVGLLAEYDVAGLRNIGYPDNSVVCHANRGLGGSQEQFIGVGALAVDPTNSRSFFPNVYNQDWFFVLGCGQPTRVAVTGRMRQKVFDPFKDLDRARREELGDCLAEGLYWLLDHRLPIGNADIEHWRDFLIRRRRFIDELIGKLHSADLDVDVRVKVSASLMLARATNAVITPRLCMEFVRRWRKDMEAWKNFVFNQPSALGLENALAYLEWPGVSMSRRPWPATGCRSAAISSTREVVRKAVQVSELQPGPDNHHSTHRHLLVQESTVNVRPSQVDALVVPASRSVGSLQEAMDVAARLNCILVAICSREVTAAEVACLGVDSNVPAIALDMKDCEDVLREMSGQALMTEVGLTWTPDTSRKRNVMLLLSRIAGWERVMFLDDDIDAIHPGYVRSATGFLASYRAVGLRNLGFPDNSVVCHAYREVGGRQDQFVGGGALAVSATWTRSFFPAIYNEDWLFLLGDGPLRVAVTGRMRQKAYDPFGDADRARNEEFGDCIAEGMYWLLDEYQPLERADRQHWEGYLRRRRRFIERLLVRVERQIGDADLKARMVASLSAARDIHAEITADLCTEYVRRWRSDLESWGQLIDDLPTGLGIDRALEHLGLSSVAHRSGV